MQNWVLLGHRDGKVGKFERFFVNFFTHLDWGLSGLVVSFRKFFSLLALDLVLRERLHIHLAFLLDYIVDLSLLSAFDRADPFVAIGHFYKVDEYLRRLDNLWFVDCMKESLIESLSFIYALGWCRQLFWWKRWHHNKGCRIYKEFSKIVKVLIRPMRRILPLLVLWFTHDLPDHNVFREHWPFLHIVAFNSRRDFNSCNFSGHICYRFTFHPFALR